MKTSELRVGNKVKIYHLGSTLVGFISQIIEESGMVGVREPSGLWFIWSPFNNVVCKYETREEEIIVEHPKPIGFVFTATRWTYEMASIREPIPKMVQIEGQLLDEGTFYEVKLPMPLKQKFTCGDRFKVTIEQL